MRNKKCGYCGKEFKLFIQKKYCSDECKIMALTKTANCLNCGKEFESFNRAKYCCYDCRRETERRNKRERMKKERMVQKEKKAEKKDSKKEPIKLVLPKGPKKICAYCGNRFTRIAQEQHCSNGCEAQHKEEMKERKGWYARGN